LPSGDSGYEIVDGLPVFARDADARGRARRRDPAIEELWQRLRDASVDEAGRWFCERHSCSREIFAADWKYLFAPPPGRRILEIGAGFGDDSVTLARDPARVVLVVPTLTSGRIVLKRLQDHAPGPWPVAVIPDLERLPLEDASVGGIAMEDAALAAFGITDGNFGRLAAEWRRVLTADGTVFLGLGNPLHRLPGAGFLRSKIQRPPRESLNRAVKRAAGVGGEGSLRRGTVLRSMRAQGFSEPTIYAPLPSEKKIDVVIPVEDRRVVRYFLDNLIRKNSPVVRAAIGAAHLALIAGQFPRLVPYHYLIFKAGSGDRSVGPDGA
jgi:hypothetical protein